MNKEFLIVRSAPYRKLRLPWWQYVLGWLFLFGFRLYLDSQRGYSPAWLSSASVATLICGLFIGLPLAFDLFVYRYWYGSIFDDGLGIQEPLKAYRKFAWNEIKEAEAVRFGDIKYLEFIIEGRKQSVTMPLPESTSELKEAFLKYAGMSNPLTKALNSPISNALNEGAT